MRTNDCGTYFVVFVVVVVVAFLFCFYCKHRMYKGNGSPIHPYCSLSRVGFLHITSMSHFSALHCSKDRKEEKKKQAEENEKEREEKRETKKQK